MTFTSQRKVRTKWDGCYKVTEVVKPKTFRMESLEDVPLARPWDADNIK